MDPILKTYIINPKQEINNLILNAESNNSELLYAICGTDYITTEINYNKAGFYLNKSYSIKPTNISTYNLGYLYERLLKDLEYYDKQENEDRMVKYYIEAANL